MPLLALAASLRLLRFVGCASCQLSFDRRTVSHGVQVKHSLVFENKNAMSAADTPWTDGRDTWWHDNVPQQATEAEVEWVGAEDPLFLLYTSGSTGKPKGVLHTTGAGCRLSAYSQVCHHMSGSLIPQQTLLRGYHSQMSEYKQQATTLCCSLAMSSVLRARAERCALLRLCRRVHAVRRHDVQVRVRPEAWRHLLVRCHFHEGVPCSRTLSGVPEDRLAVHTPDALKPVGARRTAAGSRGTAT